MSLNHPKHGSVYVVVHAVVLGAVSATVLTGAEYLLEPYRQANAAALEYRSILEVLGVPGGEGASSEAVTALFRAYVVEARHGEFRVYRYREGAELRAVAVEFSGTGYLAPIHGFLSLEPDMKTVRGIVITRQGETPGLGGQISSRTFLDAFRGKQIDGLHLVSTRRADAAPGPGQANEVDAITGASITTRRFQVILDGTAARIQEIRTERPTGK
jgi:Na+-transporting NADH:ubiquinone oxidoreductase subunit C